MRTPYDGFAGYDHRRQPVNDGASATNDNDPVFLAFRVTSVNDPDAPVFSGLPTDCNVWPPNHKMVKVATVSASDPLSGLLPGSFVVTATSDEPRDSDLNTAVVPDGAGGFDVLLRAERSAHGVGRTYTISATATAWSERGQSHRVVRRPARPGAEQVAVSVESPRRGGQDAAPRLRRPVFSATVSLLVITAMALTSGQTPQEPATAPKPQAPKGVVIRGCLTGSKLTHIEPADPSLTLPDRLRVTSIKVIRSQVKALDGHQVELVGLLRGIPGQETGLLVAESDKGKVYLGGGDPNLGQDLGSARAEPPTIHANTIKDVAPACTARPLLSRSRP